MADGLSSTPGTYTVGETQLPKVILRPPHERTHMQEIDIYKEKLGVIQVLIGGGGWGGEPGFFIHSTTL